MDTTAINQKLDKILEYQEKQAKYTKIRFWINLVVIFVFIVLPLVLLPIVISQVFDLYSGVGAGDLESATEQAQGILKLLQ